MKINKIKYSPNYYVVRQSADPQGKVSRPSHRRRLRHLLPPILDNASLQRATASLTISKSSIHELIRFEFCTYTVWPKSLVEIRFY